ncbi:MAG: hypothetical protein V1726_03325 [Methanobacteriota archaeon]
MGEERMKHIPINEEKNPTYNKKAIKLIISLVICGIITGLILSSYFVNEANERIEYEQHSFERPGRNNSYNFTFEPKPLSPSDTVIPTMGVIIICISTFLLIGLVAIYIKIFLTSSSKYVAGLLFFLFPLLIQSFFFINALRSLFVSARVTSFSFRASFGFGFGGLGGTIVILSLFEIVGLTILLYLSTE